MLCFNVYKKKKWGVLSSNCGLFFCGSGSKGLVCVPFFSPVAYLRWRCRRGPHLRCQRWRQQCCRSSAWLWCCFCASSKKSEGWREHTGPAQRRGSRQERRGRKNLVCLYRCPKKNASYDFFSLHQQRNSRTDALSFLDLLYFCFAQGIVSKQCLCSHFFFIFITADRSAWTCPVKDCSMRKI